MKYACHLRNGGSAPATPGFNAVTPEPLLHGAAHAAPAVPAAESTLGSHPCVALSSAQVLPEWINHNLAGNRFAANGDNPLNFVSHSRGSLHVSGVHPLLWEKLQGHVCRMAPDGGQADEGEASVDETGDAPEDA